MIHVGLARRGRIAFLHLRRMCCFCLLAIAACLTGKLLMAQDQTGQDISPEHSAIPTLRVATNLVRIPVLVLSERQERLSSPIAPDRFTIQLGNGPSFRPKYVRREGDDPINIAFVVDTRSPQKYILPEIDKAIATLAPSYLRVGDRVSIYVIDCSKINEVENLTADSVQLKYAVDSALSTWAERQRLKKKPPCNVNTPLWDDLGYVAGKLSEESGWRAIVVVTNGEDRRSKHTPDQLIFAAQNAQVAIFGLDPFQHSRQLPYITDSPSIRLAKVCELSGGIRLEFLRTSVAKSMQQFLQMIRERYVLEFPRPPNLTAGNITMHIRIADSDAFIRAAGDRVPVTDGAFPVESKLAPQPLSNPVQAEDSQVAAAQVAEQPPTSPPASELSLSQEQAPAASMTLPSDASPAFAPHPENTEESTANTPVFKVSTRLTVEDVSVTDGKRMPVHGLLQPDFLIKEDGKPQTIRDFEEYGTQRRTDVPSPPQLPANVYTNAKPPAPSPGAVNILLLDEVNTGLMNGLEKAPENLAYARQQSIRFLGNMPGETQVAIMQMGSTLHVLQDFTSDKAVLLAAMKSATYKPVDGTYLMGRSDIGTACAAANLQSELTVKALTQVAAFLSGIKGRKNLLWFTPGTPWLFEYPTFSKVSCLNNYTQQLHKVYSLLSEAEIAVYPIDPRGLFANPAQSAANERHFNPQAVAMQHTAFGMSTAAEHNSLRDVADATGGVPFFDRNDLDAAVREAVQAGKDYYTLSYVPPLPKYDGKYHTIEVKVDRPNLKLQYRPGYTSVDPATPPESPGNNATQNAPSPGKQLFAAMGHGEAGSTQLLFDVHAVPSASPSGPGDQVVIGTPSPALKRKPLVRYDFSYSMDPSQVALLESPTGTRTGSVAFVLVAYDGAGQMLNVGGQTLKFTLGPDEVSGFMQHPFQAALQFDLPTGEIFVQLGVMDLTSGKIGTLEFPEKVVK